MKRIVSGQIYYDEVLPFPNPSTEVRYFEDLGILIEPGAPRDLFRVVWLTQTLEVERLFLTHPHLDHLHNAIAFPEARLTRNPRRDRAYIGGKRDMLRDKILKDLKLYKISPRGLEEILEDVYVFQTDFHFPGHLIFIIKGTAFVGDAFPPLPEVEEKRQRGERYQGRLAEYMRYVAEHSERIVTAHRGEISSDSLLEVLRFFSLFPLSLCIG